MALEELQLLILQLLCQMIAVLKCSPLYKCFFPKGAVEVRRQDKFETCPLVYDDFMTTSLENVRIYSVVSEIGIHYNRIEQSFISQQI